MKFTELTMVIGVFRPNGKKYWTAVKFDEDKLSKVPKDRLAETIGAMLDRHIEVEK